MATPHTDSDIRSSPTTNARFQTLLGNTADCVTFGLLVFAPLLMGGRHPVGRFVFVSLICLIALCWLWQRVLSRDRTWHVTGVEWLVLATIAVITFQLVPLPGAWLATISPAIAERLPLWTSAGSGNLSLGQWSCISLHPDATRRGLAMFTAYALLFLVTAQRVRTEHDIRRVLRWVAGAAILMSVVGLAQLVLGNGKFLWLYAHPTRDTLGVVRGAFANQNHMAHLLALGIGPLVWWLSGCGGRTAGQRPGVSEPTLRRTQHDVGAKTLWQRPVLGTALGLVLLAGLLTFSRAGVFAMVLAGLFITAVLVMAAVLDRRGWAALVAIVLLLATALACHGYRPLTTRLGTLIGATSLEDLSAGRGLIWSAVRQSICDFPILGTGVGTHGDVYPMFLDQYTPVRFTHAESGYLQVLEELGAVGLALLLVAIGIVANWCRVALAGARSAETRVLAGAVTASLAVSALHSLVDFVWYIPACMTITVVLVACAWRLSQMALGTAPQHVVSRVPQPLFMAGSLGACVTTMVIITLSLGPARAATYWDQFDRLTYAARGRSDLVTDENRAEVEGCVDEMIECLEATVRSDPREARAQSRLAALYLQKFELAQRRAENCMSLTQLRDAALTSEFPTLQAQNQWLDRAAAENRHLLDKALRHAQRAARLSPLQGETYIYLAQLGFLVGDGNRAKRACLDQALRVRPFDDDVLMAVGSELALEGDLRQATVYWKRVFHHAPQYRQQIIALFAPQVPAGAFLKTFQPDAGGAKALFDHYRKIGFAPQANVAGRYYIARLADRSQQGSDELDADQWCQAFVVQSFLGEQQAALSCLRHAVQQAPERFALRQKLARQLLRGGEYDEARQHLQWCLRRKPDDASLKRDLQIATRADLSPTLR